MNNTDYSVEEKKLMLSIARATMEATLKKTDMPDRSELPEKFRETRSCFVTLHDKSGSLRGCIGNIGASEPLIDNIVHNAINSAFRDPRFSPVSSLEELAGLELEISVLTLPEKIDSIDKFVPGEHGIILASSGRSAVFLPQVAPEQGWDREETLTHLSLKAGLYPYAWKEADAKFSIFRAIVFSEKGIA